MAARTVAWSLVGAWTESPESLNATTPITTLGRLALHERLGRGLGRLHARRLQVVRGHAAGDVEGQDDRALLVRQRERRLRSRQGHGKDREPGQEQQRRGCARAGRPRFAAAGRRSRCRRGPSRRRRRRAIATYRSAPSGTSASDSSSGGQMKDTAYLRRARRSLAMRTMARDQVLVRGERQGLDAGSLERAVHLPRRVRRPRPNRAGSPCRACPRRAARRFRRLP